MGEYRVEFTGLISFSVPKFDLLPYFPIQRSTLATYNISQVELFLVKCLINFPNINHF